MDDGQAKKWGCGCLLAILFYYVGLPLITSGIKSIHREYKQQLQIREIRAEEKRIAEREREAAEKRQTEEDRRVAEKKAEQEAREKEIAERENRLRAFTLREAPSLWKAQQSLEAQIIYQDKKISELRKTLIEFDKRPEQDADFMAICSMREDMVGVKQSLRKKIEDAYIAYCKFQATPNRKEYDDLHRKTIEDGIQEAEAAARRFTAIREEK